MKNKKRLALVAGVLMTMSLSAGAAVLSGCGESEDPNIKIETENLKATYFADFGSNEYDVVFDGGQLTFSVAGDSRTGTFKYDGTNLKLTFADNGEEIAATLTDGKLTFTYKDVNYEMVEKKEFTVTFNAGGSNTTQEVVVGRTVSKPADPVKADNIFLGWYEDSAFTKAFSFDTKITEDTTVYARFVSSISTQQEFKISLDANYDGASAIAPVTTVNGHVYNLPTPARSGEKFLGWWVSDYNSSDKLTTKWDETYVFGANATLFAVWESDAPAVSVKSDGVSWTAKGVGNSYVVEIFDKNGTSLKRQSTGTTVYSYDFSALAAGEYTVKVTLGNKTTVAYYKNKALAPVSIFEVEGNVLKFNTVKGAQKYLVTAVCGDGTHDHTEKEVPANAFDFSDCVMVKGGIKFTVKAVADGMLSSVSEEYPVERNLDAASLRVDEASGKLVWDAVEHATAYTLKINDGTTVKTINNLTSTEYSIKDLTGNLSFTVIPSAHGYNSPDESAWTYNKASLPVPKNIRVYSDRVEWDPVDGATGYTVKIGSKVLPVTGTSAPIDVADFGGNTSVSFSVMAIGATANNNSVYTDDLTLTTLLGNGSVRFADGLVKWDAVIGATHYGISVNDGEEILVNATETSYEVILTKAGVNEIKVRSITGGTPSAAITVYAQASTVTFDANGGVSVDPAYVSDGGKIYLPSGATRYGYDFAGWYSSAEGGVQCVDGTIKNGSDDVTYYARWTAQSFKISVNPGDNGEFVDADAKTQFDVLFDGDFELPILDSKDPTKVFGGWAIAGSTQYTDDGGNSISGWNIAADTTLEPVWIDDVFKFKLVSGGREYSVSQGANITAKQLTRVKVPAYYNGKPVAIIGGDAFKRCYSLKTIEIPDTVTSITMGSGGPNSEGSAFYSCSSLISIKVYSTGMMQDVRYSDEDGILLYNNDKSGKREIVVYPKAREGACIIPDGVEIIPLGTFKDCSKLTSVSIPASVAIIEDEAFSGCTKLETIEFRSANDGETPPPLQFGENVFRIYSSGCLKEITLPKRLQIENVSDIAKIFDGNSTIQKIHMGSGSSLSDIDGVLCQGTKIVYCPRAREGVYKVPDGISEIDAKAFEKCTKITKITVPYSLKKIGEEAFSGCTKLDEIKFNITEEELDQGASLEICRKAFYGCNDLTEVTLPMHLSKLEAYAFGTASSAGKLTKVKIECAKEQFTIEDGAFAAETAGGGIGNTFVTDIEIGAKVNEFSIAGAFGVKITNLTVDPANQSFEADDGVLFNKGKTSIVYYPISKEGNYVIPPTVEKIGGRVFEGKLGLTSIEINANVTEVGANAFKSCTRLASVIFEGNRTKSLTIGTGAFESCTMLGELTLPSLASTAEAGVGFTIGVKAFYGDTSLINVTVPEGFTEIGHCAFGNTKIESLSLPASAVKIAEWCKPEVDVTTGEEIAGTGTLTEGTGTDKGKWYYDSSKKNIANIYTISIFDSDSGRINTSNKQLGSLTIAAGNPNYATINNVLYKKNADGEMETLMFSAFRNAGVDGKVTVPSTVKKVADEAFYSSSQLIEIEFLQLSGDDPSITFGERVFGSSSMLNKVTLPKGMDAIGEGMFKGASSLTEVFIPNTVTRIGKAAFNGCSSLENLKFESNGTKSLVIEDGTRSENHPAGAGPTTITCDGVFYNCGQLKNVVFPERTTEIGDFAFSDSEIVSVTFPGTLTKLGKGAFLHCAKLDTVTFNDGQLKADGTGLTIGVSAFQESSLRVVRLPAHLTIIESLAFKSNEYNGTKLRLERVTIPANVTSIGYKAFNYCGELSTVFFEEGSKLETFDLTSKSYNTSFETTQTRSDAFAYCVMLSSINLENCTNLTAIPDYTFLNCKELNNVKLAKELETLGNYAFSDCTALSSLTFDAEQNEKVALRSVGDFAFQRTGFQSFTFPESSSANGITLGQKIFDGCPHFETVTLSNSIKNLGNAFAQSKTLTTIIIPTTHTDLQSRDKLILNIAKDAEGNALLDKDGNKVGTVIQMAYAAVDTVTEGDESGVYRIPEGITGIGANAFMGQNNIRKLILPASLTTIGDEAFKACRVLEEVVISEGSQLTQIGKSAFYSCQSLKKINLEKATKLTSLREQAFRSCVNLSSIVMPASLKNIGIRAFESCINLKSATFSAFEVDPTLDNSKEYSAFAMFRYCARLEEVTLPEGITQLPQSMFEATALASVTIPSTVTYLGTKGSTSIAGSVFKDCKSLGKVVLPAGLETVGSSTFSGCSSLKTVTYSGAPVEKDDGNGGKIKVREEIGEDEAVTLPDKFKYIGTSMFEKCTSIKKVKVPDIDMKTTSTSTLFGGSMFSDCTNLLTAEYLLTTQYEKANGTTIKTYQLSGSIFKNCTNLTTVILNNRVNLIGSDTFLNCVNLKTVKCFDSTLTDDPATDKVDERIIGKDDAVTLPKLIYSIGTTAFCGCESIIEVDMRGFRAITKDDKICDDSGAEKTATISLGNKLFSGCTSLKSVIINKLSTLNNSTNAPFIASSTGSGANKKNYGACTSLTTIKYYDESTGTLVGADDCITLPAISGAKWQAFAGCTGIKALDLSLITSTAIASKQFQNFTNLETLILSDKTITINANAFEGCAKLKTIKYYDTAKKTVVGNDNEATFAAKNITVQERAFYGTGIVKLNFSNVNKLTFAGTKDGEYFANCPDLTTVILSDKISGLNKPNIFANCAKLKTVQYYDTAAKTVVGADDVATFAPTMANFGFNVFKGTGIITVDLSKIAAPENIYFNNNVFNSCPNLTTAIFNEKFTKLGGWMFGGCDKLTTVKYIDTTKTDDPETTDVDERMVGEDGVVTLPAGLIDVASNAFVNCTGITKVDLSKLKGALTAGQSTFNGCSGIQTIVLGNGFTKFVGWMFQNCTSLSTIQWLDEGGNTLHGEVGKATFNPAFKGVNVGQYNPFNGCSSITEIDLSAVTGELEGAGIFYLCKGLTKVTLGANMTVLPQSIFEACELLSDIDISKITSFGNQAFMGCSALTQVTLNDEITELSRNLFKDSGLTSVTLPANLTEIAYGAFNGSALTAITLPASVTTIGDYAFANTTFANITLHEGITEIGANAFADSGITSITLPASVTTIGEYAFAGTGLTEITLNEGLETLGRGAFTGTQITALTVPATVTYLGVDIYGGELTVAEGSYYEKDENGVLFGAAEDGKTSINYIPVDMECEEYVLTAEHVVVDGVFNGRNGIKKIVVPIQAILAGNFTADSLEGYTGAVEITGLTGTVDKSSVTALANAMDGYVFKKLIIGEGVTAIGDSAFMDFTGAEEIVLPSTVTSIGSKVLYNNETVKKINIPVNVKLMGGITTNYYAFERAVGLEEVVYEAEELDMTDARTFNYKTFDGCSSLKKVTIGSKVKMLPDNTFSGLTALDTVIINSNVLTKLPTGAFSGCSALNSFTLPSAITEIGASAFSGTAISAIDLSSVTTLGANAFKGSGITAIDLSSVTTLGANAFENCASLATVTLGAGLTEISASAFKGSGITAVDLSSVTTLGANAFENCASLATVTLGAGLTEISASAFKGSGLTAIDLSSVTALGSSAFENCLSITAITFGENLTSIGSSCFKGSGLTEIKVPASVTSLGTNAFENCKGLLTADLSESAITETPTDLFTDCTALTSVTLPDTLIKIGSYTFENCTSISRLVIPANVTTLTTRPFVNWTKDQTIVMQYYALDTVFNWTLNVVFEVNGVILNEATIVLEKVETETTAD